MSRHKVRQESELSHEVGYIIWPWPWKLPWNFFLTSILSFRLILVTHHTWFPATAGERRSSGSLPRHSATPHWEIHIERSRQRAITHGCRSFDGSPPSHRHTQLCHHSSAIWAIQRGHGGATQFSDPDGRRCWGFAYSRISAGHTLVTGGSQWWWWRITRCRGGCGHRFCQCARYKTLTLSSAPLSSHQEVCDKYLSMWLPRIRSFVSIRETFRALYF